MAEIRALTVQQPFAWAIAAGWKSVENRSRPMSYRGLLAIHAGLRLAYPGAFPTFTQSGVNAARALDRLGGRGNCWEPRHATHPLPAQAFPPLLALGAVIAVAEVTGCHHAGSCRHPIAPDHAGRRWGWCSPWAVSGQWHIELADIRPLAEPVPCKGQLGLWRLPAEVETACREQLEAVGHG